ncbi:DUF971 domain-containing protein [Ruficoccus sp. ZRK36]|uniref:gamma-butyrobetaine hydroxylase-like domain-containing protein n=1 Tax=Ruficoccus sp. ZRK36 TaxID=2866311 RepID=UPI001C73B0AF|nr:DUF971 domain-containing protein [Ruficoccus sp. ZRK36]QYY35640.1 DUF971 domain-containing protein [Ruficoccus sp. ZRK36]
MTQPPVDIQLIGKEVAIRWPDGREDYFDPEYLRANSPSAENVGEKDIFGNQYGGDGAREFPGVTVDGWNFAGNYAVVFIFSDGHNTGIYAWDTLKKLGDAQRKD